MATNRAMTPSRAGRLRRPQLGCWLGLVLALLLSAAGAPAQEGPRKTREVLKSAIDTYKRGEFEVAATLFAQAEQRRGELEPSERTDLENFGTQNTNALKGRQEGSIQLRVAEDALAQGKSAEADKALKKLQTNPYLAPADRQTMINLTARLQSAPVAGAKGDPKALLTAARTALQQGDLNGADMLAGEAERAGAAGSWLQPWADTPAKVRRDIQTARAKAGPAELPEKNVVAQGPMLTPPAGSVPPLGPPPLVTPPMDKKVQARQLLADGYKALTIGDLDTARSMANRAKDLNVELDRADPGPDQLLHEIQKKSAAVATAKAPKTAAEARSLVKEAKALLKKNKLDDAEVLCSQAAAVPNVGWGLFEDSPEKLRGDIQKARTLHDREESVKLLAEARKLFVKGQFDEAKKRAWEADKLHGPYGVLDFGERPQTLLAEIARAETGKSVTGQKPAPQVAQKKDNTLPKLPDTATSDPLVAAQAAARAKAVGLIGEARELEKRGQLVEARQKAVEAKKLGILLPSGDSPEAVMATLQAKCKGQIQVTLYQVTESVSSKPGDLARLQKAQTDLAEARFLALQFGLDTVAVEQKMVWLQQAATTAGLSLPTGPGATPLAQAGFQAASTPAGDPKRQAGFDKLEKARLELKHGNSAGARKLAEDAFAPVYGVQKEAETVLRDIDAEEHNQKMLETERSFNAGVDAYLHGDYKRAGSIFSNVDVQHLQAAQQQRLREIMATREMDPQIVAQAGLKNVLKPGTLDPAPGVSVAGNQGDEPIDHVRAMEKIQLEQMQQRTLQAQKSAMDLFKAGQEMKALEILNGQLNQIDLAGLSPENVSKLKVPLERRISEFRTLMASKLIDNARTGPKTASVWNEGDNQKKIKNQQDQVSDLVKQCNALNKEGKYKDALALAYKAKELDPDNQAVTAIVFSNNILINQKINDDDKADNERAFLALNRGGVGMMPTNNDVFPMDADSVKRLQNRASKGFDNIQPQNKNPKAKAIEYRLDQPIHFGFQDTPLRDVITALGQLSGIPVYPDELALQEASINLSHPLTMDANGMAMKSALNILLGKIRLTYVIRDEALLITTAEKAHQSFKRVVYPIADLIVPVENHPVDETDDLTAILRRHLNSQYPQHQGPSPQPGYHSLPPAPPVSSYGSGLAGAFAATSQSQAPGSPSYSTPKRAPGETLENLLMDLIKGTIQPHTWKDMGGPGTIQYYPLGMAMVINQVQEVQGEVLDLLAALRRLQDMEIAIEMRLVSVSELFYERIGVDFNVNLQTHNPAGAVNQLVNSAFNVPGLPNRNLGVTNVVSGLTPAGTLTSDLGFPIKPSSFNFSVPPFGGYTAPGVDGGLSLGLAFLSDIQVFMILEAAQGDSRTNIMQAPKITVFNGQTAFITVNTTQFVNLGIIPVQQGNGSVIFQPQNTPLPIGVNLSVTPVVSADRRFVRLNLRPTLTNLISNNIPLFPVQVQVPNLLDGPLGQQIPVGQPVLFTTFLQQPQISTITLNTTVNVPDGGTVLLGGLKTMSEGRNEAGPPILSKIPYLSRLFRNVGWGRDGQSLMILVTPRIIINEEEEQIFLGNAAPIPRQ